MSEQIKPEGMGQTAATGQSAGGAQGTWMGQTAAAGQSAGGAQGTWMGQTAAAGQNAAGAQGTWDRPAPVAGGAFQGNGGASGSPETEYSARMRQGFHIFGTAAFLYACFYAFCMYRNASGITYPFFVAGGLAYICFCFSKLGMPLKKGSVFYMGAMLLLAVSACCTDDARIIGMNKWGVFLLGMSFLLSTVFRTGGWKLGKYLGAICETAVMAFGELGRPFRDAAWYVRNRMSRKKGKLLYVAGGLAIAVPLVGVVFLLLTSADAVFRDLSERLLGHIRLGSLFTVCLMILGMFLACYCILSYLCRKRIPEDTKDRRKGEPLLAITVSGILTLLYLVFSGIQILYLFLGRMQLPGGYTYAEYAREGFFQLLAVSFLNLVLVLAGLAFFRESRVLKGVLTVMSLCTFVMIASSALRMILYIRFYYLTFLRILVLFGLAVLALLFLGILVSIFRESFPLFGYSVAVVTLCYLALSFSRPDYWIARVNVEAMTRSEDGFFLGRPYHDYRFLSTLSADAAPVLIPWMAENGYDLNAFYRDEADGALYDSREYVMDRDAAEGFGYVYLRRMQERTGEGGIRHFNLSRYALETEILFRTTEGM